MLGPANNNHKKNKITPRILFIFLFLVIPTLIFPYKKMRSEEKKKEENKVSWGHLEKLYTKEEWQVIKSYLGPDYHLKKIENEMQQEAKLLFDEILKIERSQILSSYSLKDQAMGRTSGGPKEQGQAEAEKLQLKKRRAYQELLFLLQKSN